MNKQLSTTMSPAETHNTASDYEKITSDSRFAPLQRELGAFLTAVHSLYGPQAQAIAENCWLDTFANLEFACEDVTPQWRQISIAAAHLLSRILGNGDSFGRFSNLNNTNSKSVAATGMAHRLAS